MAVDIGAEAINRITSAISGKTYVENDKTASAAGFVTSIDIWANIDITGLRVGTFEKIEFGTYKCRASEAIPGTIPSGSKVNKSVHIAVEIDDHLGCYFTGGQIEKDTEGYTSLCSIVGEYIDPGDQEYYATAGGDAMSLGGYISPPAVGLENKSANMGSKMVAAGLI